MRKNGLTGRLCSKMGLLDFGGFLKINQAASYRQVGKCLKMAACGDFVGLAECKMQVKI